MHCNETPQNYDRRTSMRIKTLAILISLCLPIALRAQTYTPDQLKERLTEQRAVEAVIWGMPAVNYDLMLQAMYNTTAGKQNEVVYWSKPVDWKNQTLTPNPDAIYFMVFFNTKEAGPVVVGVPPAVGGVFAGNIDTVWQMPLD